MIGQCGNDPAVKMAEELQEIVAAREREFRPTWLNRDDAKASGAGEAFCVDGFGD